MNEQGDVNASVCIPRCFKNFSEYFQDLIHSK